MPVPPLAVEDAEAYVGGAYLVFLVLILVYVAIMASKLQRIQRELRSVAALTERPDTPSVGRVQEREREMDSVRQETQR
jgi:hypothetical protein